ncbi:hypothetical protein VCHA40P238_230028 [Vibrio chagasii]|nr:hypothetical protein VCHA40P238_230028 [Vibrio chagasii]
MDNMCEFLVNIILILLVFHLLTITYRYEYDKSQQNLLLFCYRSK